MDRAVSFLLVRDKKLAVYDVVVSCSERWLKLAERVCEFCLQVLPPNVPFAGRSHSVPNGARNLDTV